MGSPCEGDGIGELLDSGSHQRYQYQDNEMMSDNSHRCSDDDSSSVVDDGDV